MVAIQYRRASDLARYSTPRGTRRACDRPIRNRSKFPAVCTRWAISYQHAHVARNSRQADRRHCVHTSVSLAPRVSVRASGMWRGLLCGAALMCSLSCAVSRSRATARSCRTTGRAAEPSRRSSGTRRACSARASALPRWRSAWRGTSTATPRSGSEAWTSSLPPLVRGQRWTRSSWSASSRISGGRLAWQATLGAT